MFRKNLDLYFPDVYLTGQPQAGFVSRFINFGPSGREVYPDSLSKVKAYREDLTGRPDNKSLTIYFVGDFLFVARFLPGFWGFYIDL